MKCLKCDTELIKRPDYRKVISTGFLGFKTKFIIGFSLVCLKCNDEHGPFEEITHIPKINCFPGHFNPPPPPSIPRVIVFEKKLNGRDFYDLMQSYRIADIANQAEVINRFEAIKNWLIDNAF